MEKEIWISLAGSLYELSDSIILQFYMEYLKEVENTSVLLWQPSPQRVRSVSSHAYPMDFISISRALKGRFYGFSYTAYRPLKITPIINVHCKEDYL